MHIFINLLFALTLTTFSAANLAQTQSTIDLTDNVNKIKQTLPKGLSMDILLTDINYDKEKQRLSYIAQIINPEITADKLNEQNIVDQVCYTPSMLDALKQGIAISFFYYTKSNNQLLKAITVTHSLCETSINHFENDLSQQIKEIKTTLPQPLDDNLILFDMDYDKESQTVTASVKVTSDLFDINTLQKKSITDFICNSPDFTALTKKNIVFNYKYYSADAQKLLNVFIITKEDCQNALANQSLSGM